MDYIRNLVTDFNDCPLKVVDNKIYQKFLQLTQQGTVETKNQKTLWNIQLMVPFPGKQDHQLLSKIKEQLKIALPENIETIITYKCTKLSAKFPVKHKTDFEEQNVVSHIKCPNEEYKDDDNDKTNRGIDN